MSDYPVTGDPRPTLYVIEGGPEDVGLLSQTDYTPASIEESLHWARSILTRLFGDDLSDFLEVDAGNCDTCARPTYVRWTVGKFHDCRGCAMSRLRALAKLDEAAA